VSSVPRPIAGQGYKLRFSDCFSTLSSRVWCSHQWYESPPRVGTQYVDKSGVLHIVRRRADGYPDNTISSEPCGQRAPKSFTFGYFAARMRWTGASGSGPAFWLFSTRHAANPDWPHVNPYCARHGLPAALCYSAEIDVFEGYGNHLNVFTGTVHRNSCNCYGVNDEQNSNNWHPLAGVRNLAAGWHTYAAKWTRTSVSWYVDGRLITSAPVYDSTNQPMHLLFYNWNTTDWEPGNHTDSSTPRELQTLVDWVRVWQR
jgi:beta-glucanase (GH16 family)